ncbi:hypothetical protein ACN9OH_05185 [Glaesserella parasuis]|uniref:hypothetical protein n=1 Tax=Glaesserella parasuis TaxID=738 RepID=UPI003B67EDEF
MSNNQVKITRYKTLKGLATRIRDDLNNQNFVLLYAYNGTGKTRLSMEVKAQNQRKNGNVSNTLYFNAPRIYFTGIMISLMMDLNQNY